MSKATTTTRLQRTTSSSLPLRRCIGNREHRGCNAKIDHALPRNGHEPDCAYKAHITKNADASRAMWARVDEAVRTARAEQAAASNGDGGHDATHQVAGSETDIMSTKAALKQAGADTTKQDKRPEPKAPTLDVLQEKARKVGVEGAISKMKKADLQAAIDKAVKAKAAASKNGTSKPKAAKPAAEVIDSYGDLKVGGRARTVHAIGSLNVEADTTVTVKELRPAGGGGVQVVFTHDGTEKRAGARHFEAA